MPPTKRTRPADEPADSSPLPGSAENPVVLDESPMKTFEPSIGPNEDGMDKQAQNAQTRDEEE